MRAARDARVLADATTWLTERLKGFDAVPKRDLFADAEGAGFAPAVLVEAARGLDVEEVAQYQGGRIRHGTPRYWRVNLGAFSAYGVGGYPDGRAPTIAPED